MRRLMIGMSQERLGAALGITFQQVQKYERGTNRISASRLWEMSKVLQVPVSFFFDELEPSEQIGVAQPQAPTLVRDPDTYRITHAFAEIKPPEVRRRLVKLVEVLAGVPSAPAKAERADGDASND